MKCLRDLSKKNKTNNMNGKMTTNSKLSTTEPKKNKNKSKLSKYVEQKQISRNRDHMEGYQQEGRGKGTGNKQHKLQVENRQKGVKNSMGNGEAKELICMTHGHELRGGGMLVGGGVHGGEE